MSTSTPKTKGKHLTPKEIGQAVALWESGSVTLEDLAERYKRAPETFARLFKRLGVEKGSKAAETLEKAKEKVEESIGDDEQLLAQRIKDAKEEAWKLSTLGMKKLGALLIEAHQKKQDPAVLINAFRAMKEYADALGKLRKERYVALGIKEDDNDDDDKLPTLEIREMTQDQIMEMRNKLMQSEDEFERGIAEIERELEAAETDDDGNPRTD